MTVKYQCPKCGRRFAEWGAEKIGFTCPADENCPDDAADEQIELVRMGINDDRLPTKKSGPKRTLRRPAAMVESTDDDIDTSDDPTPVDTEEDE